MTIYPDGEEILAVGFFACGFRPKVREPHQFSANVNRPATTVFGSDAFPTVWDKAASLLHSFCTTQSLVDGNKRTGWAACWLLLRLNLAVEDLPGEVDADAAEALVANVAAGDMLVPEIADALQAFVAPQLGNAGHLPPGFAVTESLEDTLDTHNKEILKESFIDTLHTATATWIPEHRDAPPATHTDTETTQPLHREAPDLEP